MLSRSEFDAEGALEAKVVEEVFVRLGRIVQVYVGGRAIKTTGEHPFWVYNRGWIAASLLQVGELLLSQDGRWLAVEAVRDTGEYETVYNLRVADYHTYFVGSEEWGFSVWAHNQCMPRDVAKAVEEVTPGAGIDRATAKRVASAINAGDKATAARILRENVQGVGPKRAGQIVENIVTGLQEQPRTYQTYTKTNPETGQVYAGRASGRGTPLENITRRERGGHDWSAEGSRPCSLGSVVEQLCGY